MEEDTEHLTCDVYTLGFVKLYAQYLKLDEHDIVEKFKEQTIDHPPSSQLIFPAPLPGRGMPSFRILALSLLILVVIIIGWKWVGNYAPLPSFHPDIMLSTDDSVAAVNVEDPAPLTIEQAALPEPPLQEDSTPVEKMSSSLETPPQHVNLNITEGELGATLNVEDTVPLPTEQPALPESPLQEDSTPVEKTPSSLETPSQHVNLNITEEAWVEVKDQEGNIIVSRIFHPGESFEFKESKNLILKTGNLKGTHLSSGEKIFPHTGKSGEIGRDIPLDPEKWGGL